MSVAGSSSIGSDSIPNSSSLINGSNKIQQPQQDILNNSPHNNDNNAQNLLVCYICLETHSDPDKLNEIVICDNCGIMVHEVCYGILDSALSENELNTNSNLQTDDSIELWFCDECKSKPNKCCELCPKQKVGPLKETEHGYWVHMVCALHTPSVQFHNTDTMTNITLSELDFHHWGAVKCEICVNNDESISGFTVKCAFSQCKHHYHVTCAQSQGLACQSLDVKNPFQIFCPDHMSPQNLALIPEKKLYFSQMVAMIRSNEGKSKDNKLIAENLPAFKQKYELQKKSWPKPSTSNFRRSRPLHSNALAVKYFDAKFRNFDKMKQGFVSSPADRSSESLQSKPSFESLTYYRDLLARLKHDYGIVSEKCNRLLPVHQRCHRKYLQLMKEDTRIKKLKEEWNFRIQSNIALGLMDPSAVQYLSLTKLLMMQMSNATKAPCTTCQAISYTPLMKLCTSCQTNYTHYACIDKGDMKNISTKCLNCQIKANQHPN